MNSFNLHDISVSWGEQVNRGHVFSGRKVTWLVLGEDPPARSRKDEQFTLRLVTP